MEEGRKRILREIPAQLCSGASPQEVKKRFQRWLVGIAPEEIARVEQELIEGGNPEGGNPVPLRCPPYGF